MGEHIDSSTDDVVTGASWYMDLELNHFVRCRHEVIDSLRQSAAEIPLAAVTGIRAKYKRHGLGTCK